MSNVKWITATTTESNVEFNATFQFLWFRNHGENDCYISDHNNIVVGDDNVTLLKAGEVARLTLPQTPATNKAYIKAESGSNIIEVHAQNDANCPFKVGSKGGEEIDIITFNATENGTYTAPSGTAYTPVVVNVASGLDYIEQVDYVQTSNSATVGISVLLQPNDIIHLDMQILRHNSEQCVIGNRTYSTEMYLNNANPMCYGGLLDWTTDMNTSPVAINERRMYKVICPSESNIAVSIMYYGEYRYPTYGNIYGIKVIRNGDVVINMLPAKIHNSEIGFMYDTINQKIYFSDTGTNFALPTND